MLGGTGPTFWWLVACLGLSPLILLPLCYLIAGRKLVAQNGVTIVVAYLAVLLAVILLSGDRNGPNGIVGYFITGVQNSSCLFLFGGPLVTCILFFKTGIVASTYPKGHCPNCEYDLTDNKSGRCPECGYNFGRGNDNGE